jgi:signal peptidase
VKRWLSTFLFVLILVPAWYFFAPTQLGGSSIYAITRGISMTPKYHDGDLVIMRKSSSYAVGDVAGYHHPQLNGDIILHRIIGVNGDQFTFKGIHNDYVDPTHPTHSELVGKAWIHIAHGGNVLTWIRTPLHAAILVLLALLLSTGGLGTLARGKRSKAGPSIGFGRPSTPAPAADLPSRVRVEYVLPAAIAITGVFALLTLVALTHTKSKLETVPDYWTQTTKFTYSAQAKKRSAVYPNTAIRTGDTVFTKLAGPLHFKFVYTIKSSAPIDSKGTEALVLHVKGETLWQRDIVLIPPRPFAGTHVVLGANLDLEKLTRLLNEVEKETDYPTTQPYHMTLTASFIQTGTVGGKRVDTPVASNVLLDFDKVRLYPDYLVQGNTSQPTDPFGATQTGTGTVSVPATVNVKLARLAVPTARKTGLGGLVVGIVLLAVSSVAMRRRRQLDEPARIQSQYGDWLVPVTQVADADAAGTDVASFEALAALADRADRAIMHVVRGSEHTYFIKEDDAIYRYVTHDGEGGHDEKHGVVGPLLPPIVSRPASEPKPEWPVQPVEPEPLAPSEPAFEAPVDPSPTAVEPTLEPIEVFFGDAPPVVPVEELPSATLPIELTPPPAAPPGPTPGPSPTFVPESPETSYQPSPVATPAPIVVPQPQPRPQVPMTAPLPVAPGTPADVQVPEVGLIRDTFLRPRPRVGDDETS